MSTRPAALPMYDADPDAVQRWWQALAEALRAEGVAAVPDQVDWPQDLDAHWRDPRLLLSQTCGQPLVTQLASVVQVVGAFRYAAPGCVGILYRSELMVRNEDPAHCIEDCRGRIAASNGLHSYSGHHAFLQRVAPLAEDGHYFREVVQTGSHRASLAAVRAGRADVCAIDAVTLAGLRRQRPDLLKGMRAVGSTAPAPGLPLVTAVATRPAELQQIRRALHRAAANPKLAGLRDALFIAGFTAAPVGAWQRLLQPVGHPGIPGWVPQPATGQAGPGPAVREERYAV